MFSCVTLFDLIYLCNRHGFLFGYTDTTRERLQFVRETGWLVVTKSSLESVFSLQRDMMSRHTIEALVGDCRMGNAGRKFDCSASKRHSWLSTRVVPQWTPISLGLALRVMPGHYHGDY